MSVNGTINIGIRFDETAALDLRTGSVSAKIAKLLTLLDGSGAGQVSKLYVPASAPSIAQSVNTDYDLSGSLAGSFGTVAFTAVKALIVVADASNPGALTLFGGTNPFLGPLSGTTPAYSLLPGQPVVMTRTDATGWAIVNSTNDNFRIATAATVGTYSWDLLVAGI